MRQPIVRALVLASALTRASPRRAGTLVVSDWKAFAARIDAATCELRRRSGPCGGRIAERLPSSAGHLGLRRETCGCFA